MRIKFLGTAAAEGTPAFFCDCPVCEKARKLGGKNIRTRSQCLINENLLIDYPPDTYMHTITGGLDLRKIESVIITHSHGDHFFPHDINMNAPPYNVGNVFHIVNYYGNGHIYYDLKPLADQQQNNITVNQFQLFEQTKISGYEVTPLRAVHDRREECLFFVIEKDGKRFIYGNDTGYFPDDTMECIKGKRFDAISLDCTTGKDRDGGNHMGFEDIIEMKKRLIENGNADEKTIFIAHHFSHNCGFVYEDTVKLLEPHGFLTSYDGMAIDI
ncbi:MAG: hypothetical protein K0R90_261 [Oscillospiraceae bacterium]|nr:hypothetical protein [Oscillospiraceae bacterium]